MKPYDVLIYSPGFHEEVIHLLKDPFAGLSVCGSRRKWSEAPEGATFNCPDCKERLEYDAKAKPWSR